MSKATKLAALVASVLGGSWLFACGCPCGGLDLSGFCRGVFTKGIVDNWCIDMVTDWLREDIFS
ncbi:MAG: hypothetical protein JXQ73_30975 [Phycisphaerae bacterium]|nr:hypothetical protein [Phycisphaerae bacterium]